MQEKQKGINTMKYRQLGKTGLSVSEIGLGAEWLERRSREDVESILHFCESQGINIFDCWMSEPEVRSNLGHAIAGRRDKWIIQGHIGSTHQNGQYVRTRNMKYVPAAFEDLLTRLQTDYIDIGVINYVDDVKDFEQATSGDFIKYVHELKDSGKIRHVGMSTHNPLIGKMAVMSGLVDMIMFSINPAFDMRPPNEDIMDLLDGHYDPSLSGIVPERDELYKLCEARGVGITVMKAYAGGRLFDAERSPFGVPLTPVQCLHYALTRPAVASVMVGVENIQHVIEATAYENASDDEKDYAKVLLNAPAHAHPKGQCTYCGHCAPCPKGIDIAMVNKLYDLATMTETPSPSVTDHYRCLTATASDCIGCGGCETRCPFGVKITDGMKKTKKLFGM